MSADSAAGPLKRTPLYALHVELGAKMVPFAGYEMPVQYPLGILKEHLHTRAHAGLFDVSHMGQAYLIGSGHETAGMALEALVPADILNLKPGQQRYTQLLNEEGGIVDDLMVSRSADPAEDGKLLLVVNASRKEVDYQYMSDRLPVSVRLQPLQDLALLAFQGPESAAVLASLAPETAKLGFMGTMTTMVGPSNCHISRSGYTGEDGFEIAVAAGQAVELARLLLAKEGVQPVGLGARDSLRLEAGLCLYGHELDEMTSPVEAGLTWSMQKRRREAGGFPGAERIQKELREGPPRVRVGIKPEGRAPARDGTEILEPSGARIGIITSGGFGPTLNGPIAMGYVDATHAKSGKEIQLMVRGKPQPARIVDLPFVPHRYLRKA